MAGICFSISRRPGSPPLTARLRRTGSLAPPPPTSQAPWAPRARILRSPGPMRRRTGRRGRGLDQRRSCASSRSTEESHAEDVEARATALLDPTKGLALREESQDDVNEHRDDRRKERSPRQKCQAPLMLASPQAPHARPRIACRSAHQRFAARALIYRRAAVSPCSLKPSGAFLRGPRNGR